MQESKVGNYPNLVAPELGKHLYQCIYADQKNVVIS